MTDHENETRPRDRSLRELILARALLRCGDRNGLAHAVLAAYVDDLRGPYARFARTGMAVADPPSA